MFLIFEDVHILHLSWLQSQVVMLSVMQLFVS